MRINQFVAKATGLSRRTVDLYIEQKRLVVNEETATLGQIVNEDDDVELDGVTIKLPQTTTTILLNKPIGYVSSREEQGNPTIYDLIPEEFDELKPAGRLDKDSSGLMLLTNDGELNFKLTHPKFGKLKIYEVELDKDLTPTEVTKIENGEILVEGKPSKLKFIKRLKGDNHWELSITEGRNRQIRKTFEELNIGVVSLKRTQIGPFKLEDLGDNVYLKLDKIPLL